MKFTIAKRIQIESLFNHAELKIISSRDIPTEHEEQRAFVSWWRKSLPGCWLHAIPNGGGRGIREAGRLKAEGVSAGVPDLFAPSLGLWIEMKKRKGGSVSQEQKDWHKHLRDCGYTVIVPKGAQEAALLVIEFLSAGAKGRCPNTIDWVGDSNA